MIDKFKPVEKTKLEKDREDFLLYVMGRCNQENKHYNQYISGSHLGILYLFIGHGGNWDYQWIDWEDIDRSFLVGYTAMKMEDK